MRQTTCRQTSLPLAPQYQGIDHTEDIKAFSWHPFQFGRRQAVSACSGSPPQCSTFSSNKVVQTLSIKSSSSHQCVDLMKLQGLTEGLNLTEGLKFAEGLKLTEGLKLAEGLKSAGMTTLQYIL